ncbi:spindle and kinetochore-associated protein 1 isoform X3 [Nasonia vitripennis]|uniref:SKA complex subunit 1 n=1 Tax=Nasonia vitripennis TaxID=7425 RepID=A0A7M7QW30_NASVI|nr:spindle and kinetochore-associated protein 1 isoform X3 [Nasonia vitripennis]XP_032455517.1 spindle and kinetochore-associated protein 1 isoform X3 [Nasonia vitripennis]XP_032455518.1 spindle and kinetochore-associated protein 1 isoform X3 [Nasonia vitripennis]XP_032455519.1 spindle and kinetochore-associated protein 1 isoform X3 [Nasonia vitripennis]XP_032455520.1 spindle and kinetochore-associated protein 1 isoform X3 [Nasonia vitripennis]XP_032455521.1 spindle and kinetochore-associated 
MATYQSLENLLFVQTQKLQDLETATELIQSKSVIQEELFNAYGEVCSIARGIQELKEDVKKMKADNAHCKELSAVLKSLDHQIQHMENNIPAKIQEYVNSEQPKNIEEPLTTVEYANNTFNNITICNGDTTANGAALINDMKSCKKVLFNDPEIPRVELVTQEEFHKIPKYMIGRYTLETLNSLVVSINQIIKAKYSIIALGKNGARKKGELDLYLHYKKEQTGLGKEEENTYFFTGEDYEKYIKAKLDKTKLNLLIALRHCKKLREIRTAKTVHYALILPS